jgi:hypothetical protein
MNQPLSLEELKIEAQKRSHLVIRREGEIAWCPLKNWKGHPTGTVVHYLLIGNRVLASTGLKNDVHFYTLS